MYLFCTVQKKKLSERRKWGLQAHVSSYCCVWGWLSYTWQDVFIGLEVDWLPVAKLLAVVAQVAGCW